MKKMKLNVNVNVNLNLVNKICLILFCVFTLISFITTFVGLMPDRDILITQISFPTMFYCVINMFGFMYLIQNKDKTITKFIIIFASIIDIIIFIILLTLTMHFLYDDGNKHTFMLSYLGFIFSMIPIVPMFLLLIHEPNYNK